MEEAQTPPSSVTPTPEKPDQTGPEKPDMPESLGDTPSMPRIEAGPKGHGKLVTILIIIAVLLIAGGAAGAIWWKHHHNAAKTTTSQTGTTSSQYSAGGSGLTAGTDNASLTSDLNSINNGLSQTSQDQTAANNSVNDQQSAITVPTN